MIFLRSHIVGFGKLSDLSIQFQKGLNVLFASNEGGKSTLQRSFIGMLYGQLRSDLRVQRRLQPWVEQYKPWHGTEYGGVLWCRLADGREVEIHRSFGKEETRTEIRTSTGEDITKLYERQRNGEVLFARFHFGMPEELFESVGVIQENKVAEIGAHRTIRDRIANLAQSGDEDLSIRTSLARLEEVLDSIGSERAPTKPYKLALDQLEGLRSEFEILEKRRAQFQDWIEDRARIAGEISRLENEHSRARMNLVRARQREIAFKIHSLEEINQDLINLRGEIDSLGAKADFPAERLEELNQLVGARDSIAKHLYEQQADREAAQVRLDQAESDRRELAAYDAFAASGEADRITEMFVNYLSLSLQIDGVQKTLAGLMREVSVLEKRIAALSPHLRDSDTDWHRMAREAAEEEQNASQKCSALSDKINHENSNLAAAKRAVLNRRMLGGVLLVLAAVPTSFRVLTGFNEIPRLIEIGFVAVFACAAVVLLIAASKSAEAARSAKRNIRSLEEERAGSRIEGEKKRKEFKKIMNDCGFEDIDAFLEAVKQSDQDRRRLADLKIRFDEAGSQIGQLQTRSTEIYQGLRNGLAKVDISCSPGNLKFQIDLMRDNMHRFREIDAHYKSSAQRVEASGAEEAELTNEYNLKCSQIKALLDLAQVDTPEAFREECLKRQKLHELLEAEASRTREFQRLADNLTLRQWQDRLRDLMDQNDSAFMEENRDDGRNAEDSTIDEPFLPYLPTIAEAEESEKRIASALSHAREEYARAVERIQQAFQNFRTLSEIEEDLAIAQRNFNNLEANRRALSIALETLEKLSRQQQEVLAPQLNAAVEHRFLRLCGHRYTEVKIDPDFLVWVREAGSGDLRLAEHLSRGTQDQLYFAMRFGMLDLVSNANEPCPSFLDEPFAAYDRTRLIEAFDILGEEAQRRQIFLFTCREDLLELAQQQEANIIRLDAKSN
jgi:DNA repair exonuclease SbcCD ATPase subunit